MRRSSQEKMAARPMAIPPQETWTISKPATVSERGIVVAQDAHAAAVGAEMLAAGGNAGDAAVATAFALGVLEPWMSGIGGVGFLLYAEASSGRVSVVDFTAVAPLGLDPARYRLVDGIGSELFGWPKVEGDRNLKGYDSICVPGTVEGLGFALERFGRLPFAEVVAPAAGLAEAGLPVDWHTALRIAVEAAALSEFPATRAVLLPQGLPPVPPPQGPPGRLKLPALAATYRRLAAAGRRHFYEGELARDLLADLGDGGSVLTSADFAQYRAVLREPMTLDYRGVRLHATPGLAGGTTYLSAMAALDARLPGADLGYPGGETFVAYAEALRAAFAERFAAVGHAMPGASSTTHLSVVDRAGNMVALTNTLLSYFGSKVL